MDFCREKIADICGVTVEGRHEVHGPEELVAGYKLVLGMCFWMKAIINVTIHLYKLG